MFHKTLYCKIQMNRLFEVSMVAELLTRFYVWCQIFRRVAFLCNLYSFWFRFDAFWLFYCLWISPPINCRISAQHCDAWGFGQSVVVYIQMYEMVIESYAMFSTIFLLRLSKYLTCLSSAGFRVSWWYKLGIACCSHMPAISKCTPKYVSVSVLQGVHSVALAKPSYAMYYRRRIPWSSCLGS